MTTTRVEWKPNSPQQVRFLSSNAFEALFGGSAGPGKTECLVMEASRQVANPKYTGILFRRKFTELEGAGGLIQRSQSWYPSLGGKYNDSKHVWKFPSGARIHFAHMEHADDMMQYQGWELAFIGFDELTTFLERQYLFMLTRCRVPPSSGLRAYVRSATNPGSIGHTWVKKRFIATDIMNKIGHFATVNGKDTRVDRSHPEALTRAFYPASLADNPDRDPNYANRIKASGDPVQIARLLEGDWDAEYTEGLIYDNWSALLNVSHDADYNPANGRVMWGVDDGYAMGRGPGTESYHPRVILFAQITPIGGVNIFDEYVQAGELSETTLDKALALPYPTPDATWIDSSAAELRARIVERNIPAVGATHEVVEGIKNVRRHICDGNGARLLKVHPRCENLIYEMSQYRRKETGAARAGEMSPVKQDDHCQDALRYLLWHRRWGG